MVVSNDNLPRWRPETPPNRITLPMHNLPPLVSSTGDPVNMGSWKSAPHNRDIFSPVNQNGSFEFDRVLKSGQVYRRVKKKGAWKPSWKSAHLVLRPNLLSVYKDADATELWASINLSDVTAVARVRKTNTQNVFGVFAPSKNYHFQGLSEQDTADWIDRVRSEAPIDEDEEFLMASPENKSRKENNANYETTDFSDAFDDRASSPEPNYGSLRSRKGRSRANTAQRIPSQIQEYSGNEMMTSCSDFSDGGLGDTVANTLPQGVVGKSPPRKQLVTDPNNPAAIAGTSPGRPTPLRNISQLSIIETGNVNDLYTSSGGQPDPSRVIRQGYLLTLRRSSGVKSWKRLWIVLRLNSLSFYKTEAEYALVKLIDMSSVINAAEIDPVSRTKDHCFQIILEDKTYRFSCNGENDLNAWLGALKSVLSRIKRRRANSAGVGAEAAITQGAPE